MSSILTDGVIVSAITVAVIFIVAALWVFTRWAFKFFKEGWMSEYIYPEGDMNRYTLSRQVLGWVISIGDLYLNSEDFFDEYDAKKTKFFDSKTEAREKFTALRRRKTGGYG